MANFQSPSIADTRQVIITVHGIRTFGRWQERLGALLRNAGSQAQILHFKYGYFSSLAFLIPVFRYLRVLEFSRYLVRVRATYPNARIDIVSHSFGTHVTAWAIRRLNRRGNFRVGLIILSGSVLKPDFPWTELLMGGAVQKVVNECGTKDSILILNQFVALFTGMAGRIGFSGLTGDAFSNNFFEFGHSGYFKRNGVPIDDFMQTRWVPFLTQGIPPAETDERAEGGLVSGLVQWLLQNSEPIKLFLYSSPFILATVTMWYLYVNALARQLASQALSERAAFPEIALLLATESSNLRQSSYSKGALIESLQQVPAVQHFLWGPSHTVEHPDSDLMDIAFSHSGKQVAVGDYGGCINVYDTGTGILSTHFCLKPDSYVAALTFTQDDAKLAILGHNNLSLWNLKTAMFDSTDLADDCDECDLQSLSLRPDGQVLASVFDDKTVGLWTLEPKLKRLATLPTSFTNWSLAFSADNRHFAIGSEPGQLSMWDSVPRPHIVGSWRANENSVSSAFSPNGSTLASVGIGDEYLHLWNARTLQGIEPPLRVPLGSNRIAFSADGKLLGVSHFGPMGLNIIDISNRTVLDAGTNGFGYPFAWRGEGHLIAAAGGHGTAAILDVEHASTIAKTLLLPPTMPRMLAFSYTADRSAILLVSQACDLLHLDLRSTQVSTSRLAGCSPDVISTAAISSQRNLVAVSYGSAVHLYDAMNGTPKASFDAGMANVRTMTFDRDGRLLAIGSNDYPLVTVYDLQKKSAVSRIVANPVGKNAQMSSLNVYSLAFSRDADSLAVGDSKGIITIAEGAGFNRHRYLTGHLNAVFGMCFSEDGRTLISSSSDSSVRFWDLGKAVADVPQPIAEGFINLLACDPHGLVAGSTARGVVSVWDINQRQIIGEPLKTPDSSESLDYPLVAFDDYERLAVYSRHRLFVWELDDQALKNAACRVVGRNLDSAEWKHYVSSPMPCRVVCPDAIIPEGCYR